MRKYLIWVVMALCVIAITIGTCVVISTINEYSRGDNEYDRLSEAYCASAMTQADTEEMTTARLTETNRYDIDFEKLKTINSDIVAWIVIEGTKVNYPVVKSHDNADYLHTTFEGNRNACGTLFIDCNNQPDFSDKNTIIYGHNMKNGSMFKTVNLYRDEKFYMEHPTVWIVTEQGQKEYNILSAHATSSTSMTYTIGFGTDTGYSEFLTREHGASLYETNVMADVSKNAVTLSTCTNTGADQRFVLVLQER